MRCDRCGLEIGDIEDHESALDCIEDLRVQLAVAKGELDRRQHIINVLKSAIGVAQMSAEQIEANTRVVDGRVEVFCLGEWCDVQKAQEEYPE